jgi:hypothetical protein
VCNQKIGKIMQCKIEDGYALKSLFENLFGRKAWYDLKESTDLIQWKSYCTRLLVAVETSAKATIQIVDIHWFEELNSEIKHGKEMIKSSNDFEQLFANLAASIGRISFLQFGLIPTRLTQENITLRHPSNWKLDSYRSVQYVQNDEQKKTLLNKLNKKNFKSE